MYFPGHALKVPPFDFFIYYPFNVIRHYWKCKIDSAYSLLFMRIMRLQYFLVGEYAEIIYFSSENAPEVFKRTRGEHSDFGVFSMYEVVSEYAKSARRIKHLKNINI